MGQRSIPDAAPLPASGEPRHTTPPDLQLRRIEQRLQRDEAAEAVRHDVGLAIADQLDQARHRAIGAIGHARVRKDVRIEAGRAQLAREPGHRHARHPETMQQEDAAAHALAVRAFGEASAPRRRMNSGSRTVPTRNS
jgi:hypothetical protein